MIQIRTLPKTVLRHLPYWTGRRNWPTFLDHYNDPMDNFLDQLTTPMSVLMASVIEPKYEKKLQNLTDTLEKKNGQIMLTPEKFQINLNIEGFAPEDLQVKSVDNFIIIEGKHEEKTDNSIISRFFSRKWAIPQGVKVDEIRCNFNHKAGQIQVEAPRLVIEDKNGEKVIPIQLTLNEDFETPKQNGETEKNLNKTPEVEKTAE